MHPGVYPPGPKLLFTVIAYMAALKRSVYLSYPTFSKIDLLYFETQKGIFIAG